MAAPQGALSWSPRRLAAMASPTPICLLLPPVVEDPQARQWVHLDHVPSRLRRQKWQWYLRPAAPDGAYPGDQAVSFGELLVDSDDLVCRTGQRSQRCTSGKSLAGAPGHGCGNGPWSREPPRGRFHEAVGLQGGSCG